MNKLHIYVFGSLCRGEVLPSSDVDLLAITTGTYDNLDHSMFSIYSHEKIKSLWGSGNPFAWHLYLESSMIYSHDQSNFLVECGEPAKYKEAESDCNRFINIFHQSMESIRVDRNSVIFDLSTAFLALRNFSSCFLLGQGKPDFSRWSALHLMSAPPPIQQHCFDILERARLLSTRGHGEPLTESEIQSTINELPSIEKWMDDTLRGS